MKLLDLAPDIHEQILFLKPVSLQNGTGVTKRNLRPVVSGIDWREQRRLFREILGRSH
jgi:hypothetical protein